MSYPILSQKYLDERGIKAKIKPRIFKKPKRKREPKMHTLKEVNKFILFDENISSNNFKDNFISYYNLSSFGNLSTEVMRKYKDVLSWTIVQVNSKLTEEQILEFKDYININYELSYNLDISMDFIEKHCLDSIKDYKSLNLKRNDLTDEWICKYRALLNYGQLISFSDNDTVNKNRQLPEYILNSIFNENINYKNGCKSACSDIIKYQVLTEEFMDKYIYKIDFAILFDYNYVVEYDEEIRDKYINDYRMDRIILDKKIENEKWMYAI